MENVDKLQEIKDATTADNSCQLPYPHGYANTECRILSAHKHLEGTIHIPQASWSRPHIPRKVPSFTTGIVCSAVTAYGRDASILPTAAYCPLQLLMEGVTNKVRRRKAVLKCPVPPIARPSVAAHKRPWVQDMYHERLQQS